MFRRIFLFILTNLAIIILGTIILAILQNVFGFQIGTGYTWLAVLALVYGFFASTLSLIMSRWTAKKAYKMKPIQPDEVFSLDPKTKAVYQTVENIAQSHGITMPEVAIYNSQEVNAFATGATKNAGLVAVSRWLLERMNADEIQGVVAHEMAHILNGDMVTMTLLQGVINAFVIFLSRVLGNVFWGRDGNGGFIYYISVIVLEIVFGMMGSLIVMAYSRRREFAADAGSASFVGRNRMIAALESLKSVHETNISLPQDAGTAAFKIDGKTSGFMRLFASHPPLDERIEALKKSI